MTAPTAIHATSLAPSDKQHLFRQVRGDERYIKNGVLTSLAFRPMPKDNGELSVDVEPLTTPQKCYEAFKVNGGDSVGVWAVTTQECKNVGLDAYLKPRIQPPPNPSHGYVDFTQVQTDKEGRKKGAKLAEYATLRGPLYPKEEVRPKEADAPPTSGITPTEDPPPRPGGASTA